MGFLLVVDEVKNQLSFLTVQEKAKLFRDVLYHFIDIRDNMYYVSGKPYTLEQFSDYLKIREHWMSMSEFDKLYEYFRNLSKK